MAFQPALKDDIVVLIRSYAKVYEFPSQNDQTNGDVQSSKYFFEVNQEKFLPALGRDIHNFMQNGLEWNEFQYFISALRNIIFKFQGKITFEEFKYRLLEPGSVDHIRASPILSYAAVYVKVPGGSLSKYYLKINCV